MKVVSLLVGFIFLGSLFSWGIGIETISKKKFKKFISCVYEETDNISFEEIHFDDSLLVGIGEKAFYFIKENNEIIDVLCLAKTKGRHDYFDYGVILSKDLEVRMVRVLKYRAEYGYQISNKRWLNQFIGKKPNKEFFYRKGIDAMSGATISGPKITNDIKLILEFLEKNRASLNVQAG